MKPVTAATATKKLEIPIGKDIKKDAISKRCYEVNEKVKGDSELIGAPKGILQVLIERNIGYDGKINNKCKKSNYVKTEKQRKKNALEEYQNDKTNVDKCLNLLCLASNIEISYASQSIDCKCCRCMLRNQEDFMSQKSGLEELLDQYNIDNNKQHVLIFLPKYHPELNFIERVWGRMKWYVRRLNDGTDSSLRKLIVKSREADNLPLSMIRRFARCVWAYLISYKEGKTIQETDALVRKYKSHRCVNNSLDHILYKLYFPDDKIYEENDQQPTESYVAAASAQHVAHYQDNVDDINNSNDTSGKDDDERMELSDDEELDEEDDEAEDSEYDDDENLANDNTSDDEAYMNSLVDN